jgi:glycosyltransferase involved in cell wall biosynthesis
LRDLVASEAPGGPGAADGRNEAPRVLIAGNKFTYPDGMGATTRVAALALGLLDNDADVRVISLLTPFLPDTGEGEPPRGTSEGVRYAYACGTRHRGATFLRRRIIEARAPLGLWMLTSEFLRGEGDKTVLVYTDGPLWITFMAFMAHRFGARCVVEVCEIPFVSLTGRLRLSLLGRLQDRLAYRMADGFIVISRFLDSYVAAHTGDAKPRLIVPILIAGDGGLPPQPPQAGIGPGHISYVGHMTHEGEVPDLVASFSQVASEFPEARLLLIGHASDDLRDEVMATAAELGLDGRVEFAGTVDRRRLSRMLRASGVLALLRRDGVFSRAGLPTKLADYLVTGRPVVATATGDIPVYLQDGVSAYLAHPGDIDGFASGLRRALQQPEEATRVGLEGRRVALERFSRRAHGARILDFLATLRR